MVIFHSYVSHYHRVTRITAMSLRFKHAPFGHVTPLDAIPSGPIRSLALWGGFHERH